MNNKLRCKNWDTYQHYKKKNKNYCVEQPWFMMYGRRLINERKFMEMTPEQRDFLVVGCWCIGSQENGFLPSPHDIAFKMRLDIKKVILHLEKLLKLEWLEEYSYEDYKEIMSEVHEQVEKNQRENGLENVRERESIRKQAKRFAQQKVTNNRFPQAQT
ncbi:hypothetical protein N9Z16_03195 [Methylophilaceae bacterium]|nr:hypothetical protein [Methylophilaceae bacterium]